MDSLANLPIQPLAYHVQMVRHLQACEPELWAWFAGGRVRAQENEAIRLDLLKTACRIERDANAAMSACNRTSPAVLAHPGCVPCFPGSANPTASRLTGEVGGVGHKPIIVAGHSWL